MSECSIGILRQAPRIICVGREKRCNGDLDIMEEPSLEVATSGYITVNKSIISEPNTHYYILRNSVKCEEP